MLPPCPECEPVKLLLVDWFSCERYESPNEAGEKEGEGSKVKVVEPVNCRLHKFRPEQNLLFVMEADRLLGLTECPPTLIRMQELRNRTGVQSGRFQQQSLT